MSATRKRQQSGLRVLFALMVFLLLTPPARAATLPSGFVEESIGGTWTEAVGLTFAPDGRMFVWERGGTVWTVENGVKGAAPFLDITEEVAVWNNYGLLGFCLHPDFYNNGYVYLLYTADRHHVRFFGTPDYEPGETETHVATIGRVTRYTARASDGYRSVDPASRLVLVGQTLTNGFPLVSGQHGVGSILFGSDGTLLATCGDGASSSITDVGNGSGTYFAQALTDGIIRPAENVGAYRCQLANSLNGKIIRIDPETGDGLPSNPFYDPAAPRAPRSRVWAMGLKTPCRVTLRPGTGEHHPEHGDPGSLYMGDVGWNDWEDLNVCNRPGMNFGWPAYEGIDIQPDYYNSNVQNLDAPNPLNGSNGCNRPFFYFRELIKQDTRGTPSWPNPCNAAVQIPASIPRFLHARPVIDWKHGSGPARVATFTGTNATTINVGAAGSPVAGAQFGGACSMGGVWYNGTDFPATYRNTYFHADYEGQWIKNFVFDTNDAPVEVRDFATGSGGVVFLATHPLDGALYYITWDSTLRRIRYVASGNQPPKAVASLDRAYGPGPLTVRFTGTNSTDPENLPLNYLWNFGDGSAVDTNASPVHVFTAPSGVPTRYNISLRVTDRSGATNTTALIVSVNNTPPVVTITSPANGATYSMAGDSSWPCVATVMDAQFSSGQLSYAWQTILHHNNHIHSEPVDTNRVTTTILSPEGCDGQTYFYRVVLIVTDPAGLSATNEVRLYPDCAGFARLLAFQAAQAALSSNRPPAGNFDLSHWYLTLPEDGAPIISPAQLVAGYTHPQWFYTGPDGAMVFWCPVTGGTTANSSYPRSELREMLNPTNNAVNWTAFGSHTLEAQCVVRQLPSSGKVIIGQIHGYVGDARPLVKLVFDNGEIDAQVKESPSADADLHLTFTNVTLNGAIAYRINLTDGLLAISVNGETQSMNIFANDPEWADQDFYFKAGSYVQDNSGSSSEGSRVDFYQLGAAHTAAPAPPSITTQPISRIVPPGTNVSFSVVASGATPLIYQWRKNGTALAGATNDSLVFGSVLPTDAAAYGVVITNIFGSITSSVATLTVITNSAVVPLAAALDTTNTWTTSGSPAWAGQTLITHDGADAAQSANTSDDSSTYMQTTVVGPGLLSFWWKVSSFTNNDYLTFYIGGSQQARISGEVDWRRTNFAIAAGNQTLRWTYSRNNNGLAGMNRAWLDEVTLSPLPPTITTHPVARDVDAGATVNFSVTATGSAPLGYQWRRDGTNLADNATIRGVTTASLTLSNVQPAQSGLYSVIVSNAADSVSSSNASLAVATVLPLSEAVDTTNLVWTTTGTPPWTGQPLVTHDGTDAARSGAIGNSTTTSFQTTVNGPGTLSYWWKVSSQTNSDLLLFYVGSSERARISGEANWRRTNFSIAAGSQVLRWTYSKNSSTVAGLDRGWVDEISYERMPAPAAPGNLSATSASISRIDLTWTDYATNESGYLIERSTNGFKGFLQIASVGSNVTSFSNTGLMAETICFYRVRATNAAGPSEYSASVFAVSQAFSAARINFQPASAPVPSGYFADGGLVYGERGNGLAYGWNSSRTSSATDRNSTRSLDQRYDTFIGTSTSSSTRWELGVPNGIYNVFLVAGDASTSSGTYRYGAEGVVVVNGAVNTSNRWVSGRANVTVSDGRLTVTNVPGASDNKICFIEITRVISSLTCQPNKAVECGSSWDFEPPAPITDPCSGGNMAITVTDTVTNSAVPCQITVTRTWRSVDGCGNTNTCSQTVTIVDTTAPTLICAAGRMVECGTVWSFDAPTLTEDNCSGTNVTIAVVNTVTNTTGFCGGTFAATRTWSATDACGNSNTCSQTITVRDTTAPTLVCPPGKTEECGTAWSFNPPSVLADGCGGAPAILAVINTVTNTAGFCGGTFAATRAWSVADACGNSNTCSQTVTVVDTTPPVLTCATNRVIECGTPWLFEEPVASDLASGILPAVSIVSTVTNVLCGNTFLAARTWSALDACGNTNLCTQSVTVVDTVAPVINCPPSRTVELGTDWNFDAAEAMDLCDGTNVILSLVSTTTNALCGTTFSATRTWSAMDLCGNTNVQSQTITVVDVTPPLISCESARMVEAGTSWSFDEPSMTDPDGGTNLALSIVSTITNASCGTTFVATRTWSAADPCGNSNTCSQTIAIVDGTPPEIVCSPALSFECGVSWDFAAPAATDLADGTNVSMVVLSTTTNTLCGATFTATRTWSATDACGNSNVCSQTLTIVDTTAPVILCDDVVTCNPAPILTVNVSDLCDSAPDVSCSRGDAQPLTAPFPPGTTMLTCTAADHCGNSNTCHFTVTVLAPLAVSGPAGQTVTAGTNALLSATASGSGPFSYVWRFEGAVIPGANNDSLLLQNVSAEASGGYCVEITGPCNSVTKCATLTVLEHQTELCTLTQGFYADPNGQHAGIPTLTLITNLLAPGPITLGKTDTRSATITTDDAFALSARLPASGPAAPLPEGIGLSVTALPLNAKGTFDNALLGQTIVLALNCRFDPGLTNLMITNLFCTRGGEGVRSFSVPDSVLESLTNAALALNDSSVVGLLELANLGLAGLLTNGPSLSEIHQAVEVVNAAFDGCRTLVTCSPVASLAPANDHFAARTAINGAATVSGRNVAATIEAGEPPHAASAAGKSVWWQWTPSQSGPVRIRTLGSSFDTVLAVYAGGSVEDLTLIVANDDSGGGLWAEVLFDATAGTAYQIAVDGAAADCGTIVLIIEEPAL